jgi:hypothetical protein
LTRIGSIIGSRELSARFALPVLAFRHDVVTVHAGDEIDRVQLGLGVSGAAAALLIWCLVSGFWFNPRACPTAAPTKSPSSP